MTNKEFKAIANKTTPINLLEKLDNLKTDSDGNSLLFQTHPSPAERIEEVISALTPEMDACAIASPAAKRYQHYVQK